MSCDVTTCPQKEKYELFSIRKGRCPVHCKPPKLKYIQPPIPKSFAPIQKYENPEFRLDVDTVYQLSYPPIDLETIKKCRAEPAMAKTNNYIAQTDMPVEGDTVMSLSYQYTYQEPASPIYPPTHDMMGSGPIQSLTTYKHDYPCKPSTKTGPFAPRVNIASSDFKMENETTMTLSYQPVGKIETVKSFKPVIAYKQPEMPFEAETVHHLSYQPYQLQPKEDIPWIKKSYYEQPDYPMDGNTIYRGTYMAPGEFVPDESQSENGDICLCVCPPATDGL